MVDVKQDVYYLEMNFDALVKSTKKLRVAASELSKFPEVKRDLALLVDKSVTFAALREVALATERKLLRSVALFDVYEGDKLPEGKKSYALSFVLEDKTRTLDEKTIERVMRNLVAQFEQKCGAQVRACSAPARDVREEKGRGLLRRRPLPFFLYAGSARCQSTGLIFGGMITTKGVPLP